MTLKFNRLKRNWKTTLLGVGSVVIGILSVTGKIDGGQKVELTGIFTSLAVVISGLVNMFSAKDEINKENL